MERIADIPVPQVVEELVEVFKLQIVEKIGETLQIKMVREHSAVLAQLTSRISAITKFDAETGDGPFAKVKGSITCLMNRLPAEAPSEASHTSYRDEGTSKATRKKDDFEADDAKHSSKLEAAVDGEISADPGHHNKICDQDSDAVLFTCDTKYKVACDTCVKDNMVIAAGEMLLGNVTARLSCDALCRTSELTPSLTT